MALNAYLTMVAARQGPVIGSVSQAGREGKILVSAASHEIVGPRDPASGRPTGKRMHKPFVVLKEIDRASPILYSILCGNEAIHDWKLEFYTPDRSGRERQHYTVRMVNANICGIHFRMATTRTARAHRPLDQEEVAFTYQRIEWSWNEGGITAMDDWETPRF